MNCKERKSYLLPCPISWESMDFTYTDGEWHPETHSRDAGSWSTTSGGITAQNNGNVDVAANFSYTQGMADITGAFSDDSLNLPVGKSGSTKLSLSGRPGNAIYQYDDKLVLTFNYKDGPRTICISMYMESFSVSNRI